jgi:hypothetical protein
MTGDLVEQAPDHKHTPSPLPPAGDLFEITVWSTVVEDADDAQPAGWSTVAWTRTLLDADKVAKAYVHGDASYSHAEVWFRGRRITQHTRPGR